jgi:hypothetical protein
MLAATVIGEMRLRIRRSKPLAPMRNTTKPEPMMAPCTSRIVSCGGGGGAKGSSVRGPEAQARATQTRAVLQQWRCQLRQEVSSDSDQKALVVVGVATLGGDLADDRKRGCGSDDT